MLTKNCFYRRAKQIFFYMDKQGGQYKPKESLFIMTLSPSKLNAFAPSHIPKLYSLEFEFDDALIELVVL